MAKPSALEWERRHWSRIEEVFEQAETLPPAERQAFLDNACGNDERLEARVKALLAADVAEVDSLGHMVAEASPFTSTKPDTSVTADNGEEPAPKRIGAFDIRHEIGRGGSCSVYLADRADGTFHKQVALKLVRRGLDTQDILRRLRQERQILARLDHENIARLLDGGSAEDGRPFFVMEYVEGFPIDEYCQRERLDLRARLELFVTVCSAVHYAHKNLTIHRDIKPSNILVTDQGTAKLLDFGIAKVLEADDALTAWQVTGPGLRYMTPAYASPEQIRGEALSTATDVYSLGVLLFRLITGSAPYDLEGLPFQRLEQEICASPPARPSQRLDRDSLAKMGLPPSRLRSLRGQLTGDLDTIATMALRKEPERRYLSAEQLAEDIRRHLTGLPVRAQPDRWSYRAKKFAGRHARALVAAHMMGLTLALVVSFFSVRLIAERDRAFQASTRAELESSKSGRVTDFLQQIFEISNPSRSLGESVTAVQLLDRGARQIEAELAGQPELQASLMAAIAQSYDGLGLFTEAERQLERSFELRQSLFKSPHEALAASHAQMGELRTSQGRYEEAERHFTESLSQRQLLLGDEDPRTAESQAGLGAVAHTLGRFHEAEQRYRNALPVLRRELGATAKSTLQVEGNLVALLYNQRRYGEAEALGRQVLERQKAVLGDKHPDSMATEGTLAGILVADGQYKEAEGLLRELWQRQGEVLGPDHPDVALAANNLAAVYYYLSRYDDAEPLYRQALEIQKRQHGARHYRSITTMLNLADLEALGRANDEAARPLYQEALALRRSLVEAESPQLVNPLISLGELELRQRRPAAAILWLEEAAAILKADQALAAPTEKRWRWAEVQGLLGEAWRQNGEPERGRALMQSAAELLEAELGAAHSKTRKALARLKRQG